MARLTTMEAREAFDKGLTRYFTGRPCKHGHRAERRVINGSCVACEQMRHNENPSARYEKTKAWRKQNPEARTEEARRYRAKHPDEFKERQERWRQKNIQKVREQNATSARIRRRGNPVAEKQRQERWAEKRDEKLAAIAGRPRANSCDLCGSPGRTVFDHCHTKGHFRGWLCDRCNRTLGQVKDSIELLHKMIAYLEEK